MNDRTTYGSPPSIIQLIRTACKDYRRDSPNYALHLFLNAGKGFPSWNVSMTITWMPRPRFGLPEAGKDKIPQLRRISYRNLGWKDKIPRPPVLYSSTYEALQEDPAQARFSLISATLAMCAPANDRPARCELFSWNVGFSRQQILFSVSRYYLASADIIKRQQIIFSVS